MKFVPVFSFSFVLVVLATQATGQSVNATLQGTITDSSAAILVGATVTTTHRHTGLVRSALSDRSGRYNLLNLPPGTYDVQAEFSGFAAQIRREQILSVGATINLDFSLEIGGIEQVLQVNEKAPILETTKNTLARLIERQEIDDLPVIDRRFNDLAALAPGVTNTGLYGGVEINGSRDWQNAYQVDGVSSELHLLGTQRIEYSQDWIQEFAVLTSQYSSEFGGASGGVMNAITRSGGNQPGGRVYGFFRDGSLDAVPEFATSRTPLSEQRIGATVGAPIRKDRLFFFGGFEWFNNSSSNIVNSSFPAANGSIPFTAKQNLSLLKLDYPEDAFNTFHFRYNTQRRRETGADIGGVNTEEFGRDFEIRANDIAGSWNRILRPNILNEFRMAYGTFVAQDACNFAKRNPPGTWFARVYPGANLGCPVNIGKIGEDQVQTFENLSWNIGRHDIKAGVQAQWTRLYSDHRNLRDGIYFFDRDISFSLENPSSYPFRFFIIQGPTRSDVASWSTGFFLQDNWRVNPRFTLNLGVRYGVDGAYNALNRLVRLDKGLQTIDRDLNNIAPRVGLAWTPFDDNKRTLLRSGLGIYYDQTHNNRAAILIGNNILVDRQVLIDANRALFNPFWPDVSRARRFLAEALARDSIPDTSSLGSFLGGTSDIDKDLQVPGTMQGSAGVVHEFRKGWNVSADFVYTCGFNQYISREVNLEPVTFRPINPNYSSISSLGNGGYYSYKSLQVQANFSPSSRSFLKVAYTLAKNRSNTATTLDSGGATNPFDYSEDEGPADNDIHHVVSLNGSMHIPLGLQLAGIFNYRSAFPYSVSSAAPRPDGQPFRWRPEPRNSRRGDSFLSLDTRLSKIFKLGERRSVAVFAEGYNLTNTANLTAYVGALESNLFLQPTKAEPNRRFQFGFRIDF